MFDIGGLVEGRDHGEQRNLATLIRYILKYQCFPSFCPTLGLHKLHNKKTNK